MINLLSTITRLWSEVGTPFRDVAWAWLIFMEKAFPEWLGRLGLQITRKSNGSI